jgi:hypothetical protein
VFSSAVLHIAFNDETIRNFSRSRSVKVFVCEAHGIDLVGHRCCLFVFVLLCVCASLSKDFATKVNRLDHTLC